MADISLSVGIVTWRSSPALLERTLKALARAVRYCEIAGMALQVRVFMMDNDASGQCAPEPDSLLSAAELSALDELRRIPMPCNLGYGMANNAAMEAGLGDFHLVLNPDVELDESALAAGLGWLLRDDRSVMVVPEGRDATGKRCHLAKREPSLLVLFVRALGLTWLQTLCSRELARYEMHDVCAARKRAPVLLASGCCMLIRSDAFAAVGGFCPDYFLYFEDFDLSHRLGGIGSLVYLPEMCVVHHGGFAARKGNSHRQLFLRSMVRYFNRWGWRLV